jgi:hypothetical protein
MWAMQIMLPSVQTVCPTFCPCIMMWPVQDSSTRQQHRSALQLRLRNSARHIAALMHKRTQVRTNHARGSRRRNLKTHKEIKDPHTYVNPAIIVRNSGEFAVKKRSIAWPLWG